MQGMGILFEVADPFWKLTPPPGVMMNPLGYYCAPNAATPDYVASYNIRDFLAYGFICCYDCVTPDNFTMWNMVEADDVTWLRENFLRVVEKLIINIYGGAVEIPTREDDFDPGQWSESLTIGDDDENDDDEQFVFDWTPGPVHEDAIAFVLRSTLTKGEGTGGDDEVIWLSHEALQDRAVVKTAIEEARKINALEATGSSKEAAWAECIAAQPAESE